VVLAVLLASNFRDSSDDVLPRDVLSRSLHRVEKEDSVRWRDVETWGGDGQQVLSVCEVAYNVPANRAAISCTTTTETTGGATDLLQKLRYIEGTTYLHRHATGKWARVGTGDQEFSEKAAPAQVLRMLQGAEVDRVGSEIVHGAEVTEYALRLSAPKKELGGARRAHVWIEANGLLRRLQFTEAYKDSPVTMGLDYTGYGEDIHVDEPTGSQLGTMGSEPTNDEIEAAYARCRGREFEPLQEPAVSSALRRHGYAVFQGLQQCVYAGDVPFTIDFGNTPFGSSDEETTRAQQITVREGIVVCELATTPREESSTSLETRTEKPDRANPAGVSEFTLANLTCSIFPVGPGAAAQTARLERTLSELEQSLR